MFLSNTVHYKFHIIVTRADTLNFHHYFISNFLKKIFHYAYYYSQNLLIILIVLPWFYNFSSFLQSKTATLFCSYMYRIAVIVAKCSVTSVWGYELLCGYRSIRVSYCCIRVSQPGKLFLCNYALKLHQNSGIILDSFTPSLFPA